MDRTKLVIGALVLLTLFFCCGVGAGFTIGDRKASTDEPWVEAMGKLLVQEQPVRAEEITNPSQAICLQGDRFFVPAGGECTFTIGESSAQVRALSLSMVQGFIVRVTLEHPDALTVKARLTRSRPEDSIDVFKQGGTLRMACDATGSGCEITFR